MAVCHFEISPFSFCAVGNQTKLSWSRAHSCVRVGIKWFIGTKASLCAIINLHIRWCLIVLDLGESVGEELILPMGIGRIGAVLRPLLHFWLGFHVNWMTLGSTAVASLPSSHYIFIGDKHTLAFRPGLFNLPQKCLTHNFVKCVL